MIIRYLSKYVLTFRIVTCVGRSKRTRKHYSTYSTVDHVSVQCNVHNARACNTGSILHGHVYVHGCRPCI